MRFRLLEQARAYSGDRNYRRHPCANFSALFPKKRSTNLSPPSKHHSADRVLALVHRFQKEGRNLQHFCRETIRHFRNLLVANVCGADSELIAATPRATSANSHALPRCSAKKI